MRSFAHLTLATLILLCSSAQATGNETIVFSTAPTHSKDETVKLYTPLMNYLSRATGKEFVLDPVANFIEYSVRMRLDKYDMLFDGPHLTGWRMVNMNHIPLVRMPGMIKVVVVADKDSNVKSLEDLGGGYNRVCAFASPNMLTMSFLSYFPNPIRQPYLVRTQGFKELINCLKSGHGEAAVLRDKHWEKMSDEDKSKIKLIAELERGYPERTLSVSPRINAALRRQITEALLSEEGQQVSKSFLARFNKDKLIPAIAEEYRGLDMLLRPVWGFHLR